MITAVVSAGGLRTTAVELERRLESDALLWGGRFGVGGLCSVEGVDVGLVMFLVVKLHDLAGDVGLEAVVRIREIGESVGHGGWIGVGLMVGCGVGKRKSED